MDLFIVKISEYDGKQTRSGERHYFSTIDKAETFLDENDYKKNKNPFFLRDKEKSHWTKNHFFTAKILKEEIL